MIKITVILVLNSFFYFLSGQRIYSLNGVSLSSLNMSIYSAPTGYPLTRLFENINYSPYLSIGIEYLESEKLSLLSSISFNQVGGKLGTDYTSNIYRANKVNESLSVSKLTLHQQLKYKPFSFKKVDPYITSGAYIERILSATPIAGDNSIYSNSMNVYRNNFLYGLSLGIGLRYFYNNKISLDILANYFKPINSIIDEGNITNGFGYSYVYGDYKQLAFVFGISYNLNE